MASKKRLKKTLKKERKFLVKNKSIYGRDINVYRGLYTHSIR